MRSDCTNSVAMASTSSSMRSGCSYQNILNSLSAKEKRCALAIFGLRLGRYKPDDVWIDNFVRVLASLKAEEKQGNEV